MLAQLLVTWCCFILCNGLSVDTNLRVEGSCPKDVLYEDMCPSGANDSVCMDVASVFRPALRVCLSPVSRKFQISIRVDIGPHQVDQAQGSLWMRGRGPTLSWETATEVRRDPLRPKAWVINIEYIMDSDSKKCLSSSKCTGLQNAVEFRLYLDKALGPSNDMLGPNFYIPLPVSNSMLGSSGSSPSHVTVYPWFSGVRRQMKKYYRSFEGMGANFSIFLPPSFDSISLKKYPLVVVLGTRASLVLPSLVDVMYTETLVHETVIVFIDNWGPETEDLQCNYSPYQESTVWKCKDFTEGDRLCCKHCQSCWESDLARLCSLHTHTEERYKCLDSTACRPHRGELLLEFISTQLVGVVQTETNERVMFDPPRYRISVIGYGIMGLLSCHAAITRPYFFGNAGCLSAPFYWPLDRSFNGKFRFQEVLVSNMPLVAAQKALHCTQKYYIDVGERDDYHLPQELSKPVRDATKVIDTMKRYYMLKDNENIIFSVVPKASNNHCANPHMSSENLFRRFRGAFQYIMRPEGAPRRNKLRVDTIQYEALPTNSSVKPSYSCSNGIGLPVFLCSLGKEVVYS